MHPPWEQVCDREREGYGYGPGNSGFSLGVPVGLLLEIGPLLLRCAMNLRQIQDGGGKPEFQFPLWFLLPF